MTPYKDLSREELLKEKENLEQQFAEIKAKGLKLDMSRGKPSTAQLNLSMGMMDVLDSNADLVCEEGVAETMAYLMVLKKQKSFWLI